MSQALRAGVVGAGVFGGHHARKYASLPGVELVGVFDPHEERTEALAGTLGGGYWLARKGLAPVDRMAATAAEITSSRLDRRLETGNSQDELGRLAGTFNDMIARLQLSFEEVRRFTADAAYIGWGYGDALQEYAEMLEDKLATAPGRPVGRCVSAPAPFCGWRGCRG